MTAIGALRIRLTLEAPLEEADGEGGVARSWAAVTELWAAVEPLGAGETIDADRATALYKYGIVVRHRDDLSAANRFRLGGRVLAIRAVRDPDERGVFLECLAEEQP